MRPALVVGLLVAMGLTVTSGSIAWSDGDLPTSLAGYRSWKRLTSEAKRVPYQLSWLCMTQRPRLEDVAKHGPHTNRWIMVYANPSAEGALRNQATTEFPPGAVIVKEKLLQPTATEAEGTAFMIKHPKGEFSSSGGWEFLYYPEYRPAPGVKASYETCIACHRTGAAKDYVFGRYGEPSAAR
jgi:Cytochrome P460